MGNISALTCYLLLLITLATASLRWGAMSGQKCPTPWITVPELLYPVYTIQSVSQTGWTAGWMFVYTMQPVVQPVVRLFNRLFNGLNNRLNNRLYCVYRHSTGWLNNRLDNRVNVCLHDAAGCSTGCSTCLTTGCIVWTGSYVAEPLLGVESVTPLSQVRCSSHCITTPTGHSLWDKDKTRTGTATRVKNELRRFVLHLHLKQKQSRHRTCSNLSDFWPKDNVLKLGTRVTMYI